MANKNDYVSNERLYLDKNDKVVKADDPARVTLLVAAGASIPREVAVKYGLVGAVQQEASIGVAVGEAETDQTSEDNGSDDLESLKVAELKELAEQEEVDLSGITLKADIIAAIEAKRSESAE